MRALQTIDAALARTLGRIRTAHRPRPARAAALAVALALSATGCAPTLPVLREGVSCPFDAAVLARRCEAPQALATGITYGELLSAHQRDRQALRDCAAHDAALAGMVQACQQAIADYNARLAEINRQAAEKR